MPTDVPLNKRTYYNRKTIPKTGRVREQTNGIIKLADEIKEMKRLKYRSKFELELAKVLANNKVKFEYESKKFLYVPKVRTYTPDFYLPKFDMFIETKGQFVGSDRSKHKLIAEQYPDLDLRFVFQNDKVKLNKKSKTTYADWCNKHGYKFCKLDEGIPKEWLDKKNAT